VQLPTEAAMRTLLDTWSVSDGSKMSRQDCKRICDVRSSERRQTFEKELGGLDNSVDAKVFAEWWVQADFIEEVRAFIPRVVPGRVSELDAVGRVLKFLIKECNSLLDIFEAIENNKAQVHIDEYSINQFSLEQIFNDFAKADATARQMSLLA
jgi:hypothetical protein